LSSNDKPEENNAVTPYGITIDFFSPNRMLVESATMIFIGAFFLMCFTVLVARGATLSSNQILFGVFGLFTTFIIAARQYASFR
jgi:positive regulator of sigma E activity|tara:strand:- start:228 stop:479 length:252 start_codon:yes stop_codon:yes gene_type:complete